MPRGNSKKKRCRRKPAKPRLLVGLLDRKKRTLLLGTAESDESIEAIGLKFTTPTAADFRRLRRLVPAVLGKAFEKGGRVRKVPGTPIAKLIRKKK